MSKIDLNRHEMKCAAYGMWLYDKKQIIPVPIECCQPRLIWSLKAFESIISSLPVALFFLPLCGDGHND